MSQTGQARSCNLRERGSTPRSHSTERLVNQWTRRSVEAKQRGQHPYLSPSPVSSSGRTAGLYPANRGSIPSCRHQCFCCRQSNMGRGTATAEWRKSYYKRRIEILVSRLGGQCVGCGSLDRLEFDHIDSATKKFEISLRYDAAEAVLVTELAKCQLLCWDCHRLKSILNGDIAKPAEHGTYAMYRHHKCRCAPCRAANAAASRTLRAKSGALP